MYFDQAQLGMSREYLIKGIDDEDVRHYYNFMQKVMTITLIKMKQFKDIQFVLSQFLQKNFNAE
jgi:hypothetical protein